jgi:molybdopterin synthase catalytic subunit
MKLVFSGKLDEALQKSGKKVVKVSFDGKEVLCKSENLELRYSVSDKDEILLILEMLVDFGYDVAIVEGFETEYGVKPAKISTMDELDKISDIETLRSLIKKVKAERSEMCGAIGIFIGFVRKIADGKEVIRLEYEAYDEVFDGKLREIEKRLEAYPGVEGVKIFHRRGVLLPGEDIVYVVVMGRHRKHIWEPLSKSMEIVKEELPVWKKEVYSDGEVWVHDKREY